MNKRYLSLASMMTLCFLLLLISGCSSSDNKEGRRPDCCRERNGLCHVPQHLGGEADGLSDRRELHGIGA